LKTLPGPLRVFDPSFSFEVAADTFSLAGGEPLRNYRKHWREKKLRWQIEKVRFVK
jgi:hypothetical protein